MSFAHLPVTSLEDATRNLEQLRSEGVQGLEVPVTDLGDLTTNFEKLGPGLPHVPVLSLEDVTKNFEALDGSR